MSFRGAAKVVVATALILCAVWGAGGAAIGLPAALPAAAAEGEGALWRFVARQVGPAVVEVRRDNEIGTGFFINPDGYVLTAAHVVSGAKRVTIVLADGRATAAEVLKVAEEPDVAILKAGVANVPVVRLGDSDRLEPGEPVLAFGSPFGLGPTLSQGIVNGLVQRGVGECRYIQTDASIDKGSSGGPLVNSSGEVVGITAMTDEQANGLGFAIPVSDVARLLAVWGVSTSSSLDSCIVQSSTVIRAAGASGTGVDADREPRGSAEGRGRILRVIGEAARWTGTAAVLITAAGLAVVVARLVWRRAGWRRRARGRERGARPAPGQPSPGRPRPTGRRAGPEDDIEIVLR